MGPTREQLRAFVRGHTIASEFIDEERARRLRTLTAEQARSEFDELCGFLARPIDPADKLALEDLQIEHLLKRRKGLDRLAERLLRS